MTAADIENLDELLAGYGDLAEHVAADLDALRDMCEPLVEDLRRAILDADLGAPALVRAFANDPDVAALLRLFEADLAALVDATKALAPDPGATLWTDSCAALPPRAAPPGPRRGPSMTGRVARAGTAAAVLAVACGGCVLAGTGEDDYFGALDGGAPRQAPDAGDGGTSDGGTETDR